MRCSKSFHTSYSRTHYSMPERTSPSPISAPLLNCAWIHLFSVWCFLGAGTGNSNGFPSLPIVVNIFVWKTLGILETSVTVWLRYVDNVFTTWAWGDHLLKEFHQHPNMWNLFIQFRMEKESEGTIAFFNVKLEKRSTMALLFHK